MQGSERGFAARLCVRFYKSPDKIIREGCVSMNVFESMRPIIGAVAEKEQRQGFEGFFRQAALLRHRLGAHAVLLDNYLSGLFLLQGNLQFCDAAGEGFNLAGELIGLCAQILSHDSACQAHWFYPTAKAYVDQHPLAFENPHTAAMLYFVSLHHDFLEKAASDFYGDVRSDARFLPGTQKGLYSELCAALGSEEEVDTLNRLFLRRFVSTDLMSAFYRGAADQLASCLNYLDGSLNKKVFQLVKELNMLKE
mgnify:CR=1 FL=1